MKTLLAKLDNFWYHYKWHTIFIAFFLAVFTICAVQCAQKEDPDASILYSGPSVLSADQKQELGDLFSKCLEKDGNADGRKLVSLTDVVILSDEQIAEKKAEAEAEGDMLYYDPTQRTVMFDQVRSWLIGGEMMLAVLDPFVYEKFEDTGLFVPLADIFEEVPEAAYDPYAVRVNELDFFRYHTALYEACDGAVMCLIRPTAISSLSGNASEEWYEAHAVLFRNIVEFSVSD
ncbi:MAG: hypothetical protein IKC63_05810 [Clostridia bacterium]|nr:hypothetical protein [Clostridia bacterium]